jgi:hypothetical protein
MRNVTLLGKIASWKSTVVRKRTNALNVSKHTGSLNSAKIKKIKYLNYLRIKNESVI